jgi:tetratricopeptide (TPR) repeat protein
MRLAELMKIIEETRDIIEAQGTLVQKARWFESLVLLDLRRYRYYQLPYETLENAKKYIEVAWSSRNRRVLGRATSILGFVHLWRNELVEAEQNLLHGLKDVEAVGDVDTHLIDLNYMALIGRKRADIELTQEWAQRTLTLANQAKNSLYTIHALGSLAWVQLHIGDEKQAQVYLQEALTLSTTTVNPFESMALGPALAIEVRNQNWELAFQYVKALLQPNQQKMPDEVQSMLEQAVACWEAGDLESASALLIEGLELTKQKQMGYV